MNKNNKKSFSTANLFFIGTVGVFAFKYFYNCWEKTVQNMPLFSNVMLIIMIIIISFWLFFKFPLFVNTGANIDELSLYDNIYSKNIKFVQRVYLVFFEFTKPSKLVSLFSSINLKLGIRNRTCKFLYEMELPKTIHRVFDIAFTIIASIAAFFTSQEITKFGTVCGLFLYAIVMLNIYKKVILNHIYSVNISKVTGYKLNIIYPYNIFEGLFSKLYAFACDMSKTILLNQQVFCGGDKLRNYVIAHEEGHLATRNPQRTFLITLMFIWASFFGIVGPCIAYEFYPTNQWIQWFLVVLYIIFLLIFNKTVISQNKKEEFAADVYAIKKIGKAAVIDGLEIIKSDNVEKECNLSGTPLDRRIEFVKEYKET